ncbi:MAG: hypothetical protein PVF89_06310 [Lysobacterales bacterium]|jgi:hypothetical protein
MPNRKRIPTTTTERPHHRGNDRLLQIRREIAAEAARIMSTQSQSSFLIAKQKAAQRLGIDTPRALPSNVEVEDALRAYQGFYAGEQHLSNLRKMRRVALKVMRSLAQFSPRLVGPVLSGTADRHARISLHVFNDPPDAVLMHLMNQGLRYRNEQRRIRWYDGGYRMVQLLLMVVDGLTVELALFNSLDLRMAPPSPVDGRPQKRAPLAEVESLLAGPGHLRESSAT